MKSLAMMYIQNSADSVFHLEEVGHVDCPNADGNDGSQVLRAGNNLSARKRFRTYAAAAGRGRLQTSANIRLRQDLDLDVGQQDCRQNSFMLTGGSCVSRWQQQDSDGKSR